MCPWCDFLRLPGASSQKCIHRFLFQIAEHYREEEKAIDYVLELLNIKAPALFAVRQTESGEESQMDKEAVDEFKHDLWNYIAQNNLNHKLLSVMKEIMVRND